MKSKYITLKEGVDFRKIAEIMTRKKYVMNHATARNVLMTSLSVLVKHISEEIGSNLEEKQIEEMLKTQSMHEAISEVLFKAYFELKKEIESPHDNP